MPLYGVAQCGAQHANPGLNLTGVFPGEQIVLFNGTETPASGTKSVAFMPQSGPTLVTSGVVFSCNFASGASSATINIEGADQDIDAAYQTLGNIITNTANGYYADLGGFMYYRANMTTYASGGMPVLIAKR